MINGGIRNDRANPIVLAKVLRNGPCSSWFGGFHYPWKLLTLFASVSFYFGLISHIFLPYS